MEDVEDPKPSDQMENSEAKSILAAIEAKLDSETGSVHSDTDSDDDEDAFERKIKIVQGGFHEVLMAKPAEKAEIEEPEPKTPSPENSANGEEGEEDPQFPEVKELTEDESAKKTPSSKKKKKICKEGLRQISEEKGGQIGRHCQSKPRSRVR